MPSADSLTPKKFLSVSGLTSTGISEVPLTINLANRARFAEKKKKSLGKRSRTTVTQELFEELAIENSFERIEESAVTASTINTNSYVQSDVGADGEKRSDDRLKRTFAGIDVYIDGGLNGGNSKRSHILPRRWVAVQVRHLWHS